MINRAMRNYEYFTYGDLDEYGQAQLSENAAGTVKMAISITSQSISDSIKYKDAEYIGLTLAKVDDTYIIKKDEKMLKVLYVNPDGRYTQVFMSEI